MKSLYESILDNTEDVMNRFDDDFEKIHILKLLRNPEWFTISNNAMNNDACFDIRKHRGQWVVDVKREAIYIVSHCPEGYITDGSFRFGSCEVSFTITPKVDGTVCRCKSLKYSPTVSRDFQVDTCPDLKDFKDCPRHVYDSLFISNTGITSLKYLPISANDAAIKGNKDLKSLKGAKKMTVDHHVVFYHNGFECTEQMIKDIWNVKGLIYDDNSYLAKMQK